MTSLCLSLHQGTEGKVLMLEKKMEDLLAENKPISGVLRQLIQVLCAEEVWIHLSSFPSNQPGVS